MKTELFFKLARYLKALRGSSQAGFTLVELAAVLVVIGILAAIVVPGAIGLVNRARVSEARSVVNGINSAQRQFYAERGRLAETIEELGAGVQEETEDYTYSLSLVGTGINQYSLAVAEPVSQTVSGVAGKVFFRRTSLGDLEVLPVACVGDPGQIPVMTTVENETQCPE